MIDRETQRGTYWPAWRPVPARPWVLQNERGENLRRPREGRMHRAHTFATAQDAESFARCHDVPLATPAAER